MPPSGRAGKGRAPAALKGAALRAASLHPRLFMLVAVLYLHIAIFQSFSLSSAVKMDCLLVMLTSFRYFPSPVLLTPGDFPAGTGAVMLRTGPAALSRPGPCGAAGFHPSVATSTPGSQ